MKLTKKTIKDLIERIRTEPNMVLEEPILQETSFSRVKDKVDKKLVGDFIVISGDRHENSPEENNKNYTELQALIVQARFPFAKQDGSWVETDEKTGKQVRVHERSLIVYNEKRGDAEAPTISLFELGKDLCQKFKQDAFIYGFIDKTQTRQIQARYPSGAVAKYGGPWTTIEPIEKDADFWSKVRGSAYVFTEDKEEILEVDAPNSVIEAMIKGKQHEGKKIKFVRRSK